ncbi:phosphate ABC transporter permease PstA [Prosthecomicrobium sp. N25]|uniref:phosphate ABC transporter permease PstA n=1 Tax=Prosthecomicrobium sp. N25 TaxID=3129254 RepID=UPI003076F692
MTDLSLSSGRSVDITSDAARARIKARYRAEARFKAYGVVAIAFAGLFLVLLLADIVLKALPAFTTHALVLDVPLTAETVDPSGRRDPDDFKQAGDFAKVVREALYTQVPALSDRAGRKTLNSMLSSSAADGLRRKVGADPALIGTTVKVSALVSDDADLYLKGFTSNVRRTAGTSALTLSVDGGTAVLQGPAGSFTPAAPGFQGSTLVRVDGGVVKASKVTPERIEGEVLVPLAGAASAASRTWELVQIDAGESVRKITDKEIAVLELLRGKGLVEAGFNWSFFTTGDSREAESAGILGALVGSAMTMLVTLVICLPLGVGAAIYLEEFAPKNRWTELIEVNINNLAAVPSIVFGLLGLAVFLNFFGLPRSAPLVGGLVLALLVLPTIIIASRAALKAVPPSIREAALGVGASKQQAIFHHVLPLAMPGILTGTIIGMAHALGETAPLLMIGMVAFIVDVPHSISDAATVLPVQIFLWSDLPEVAFQAKTAAAILVLLAFLFVMNGLAIVLRKKFERRW